MFGLLWLFWIFLYETLSLLHHRPSDTFSPVRGTSQWPYFALKAMRSLKRSSKNFHEETTWNPNRSSVESVHQILIVSCLASDFFGFCYTKLSIHYTIAQAMHSHQFEKHRNDHTFLWNPRIYWSEHQMRTVHIFFSRFLIFVELHLLVMQDKWPRNVPVTVIVMVMVMMV